MIEIEIDYREKKIIDLLTIDKINIKTKKDKSQELIINTKNLDIGDIILNIKKKDIVLFTYLIERKSISDMLASVKDGRYKEQKLRLKHNKNRLDKENIPNNYFYILEGTNEKLNRDELKLLYGSWISTTFRDNINIIRVMNVQETTKFIIRLVERMYKDKKEFINSNIKTIIVTDKNNKNNEDILKQKHLKDNKNNSENKINLESNKTDEPNTKTIITKDINSKSKQKTLLELSRNEKNKNNNLDENNINKNNSNDLQIKTDDLQIKTDENIISNTNEREYLDSLASGIKKKKKENLTSNVCQNMMLCQIPGIQTNISTQIINHFGSLSKLLIYLNSFSSNDENNENNEKTENNENNELLIKNLSEIKIKTNTGKERKLGKSIANNIIDFLL